MAAADAAGEVAGKTEEEEEEAVVPSTGTGDGPRPRNGCAKSLDRN
jgi:hypothetical protein